MKTKNSIAKWCYIATILVALALIIALLCACNVTRTTTTSAQHYQKGDTTVTIMTKTIESYDGSIKPKNMFNN